MENGSECMSNLLGLVIVALLVSPIWMMIRLRPVSQAPSRERKEFEMRSRFQALEANQVTIQLDEDRSGKVAQAAAVAVVEIELEITPAEAARAIARHSDLELFECWTRLPIGARPGAL